mmetsp:Transcript_8109/g.26964  ORF Transcript_8109/g.26964 Transcript_8109/m.26964 type:complete len:209 (+) Transcript_8109:1213-1839(+)
MSLVGEGDESSFGCRGGGTTRGADEPHRFDGPARAALEEAYELELAGAGRDVADVNRHSALRLLARQARLLLPRGRVSQNGGERLGRSGVRRRKVEAAVVVVVGFEARARCRRDGQLRRAHADGEPAEELACAQKRARGTLRRRKLDESQACAVPATAAAAAAAAASVEVQARHAPADAGEVVPNLRLANRGAEVGDVDGAAAAAALL